MKLLSPIEDSYFKVIGTFTILVSEDNEEEAILKKCLKECYTTDIDDDDDEIVVIEVGDYILEFPEDYERIIIEENIENIKLSLEGRDYKVIEIKYEKDI